MDTRTPPCESLQMPPTLRAAEPSDFDAIAAITNVYILGTAIHFGTEPVTSDELRREWLASRDRHPYLVAVVGDEVVGFAKASSFRARAAYARTAELGVYVHDAHQRRGLARGLYRAVIADCRARGFHSLIAGIALPNEASVALHEALGFGFVGVFHQIGFKFGAYHDVGFWELQLGLESLR